MIGKLLDNTIGVFSPSWAFEREVSRAHRTRLKDVTNHYQGGKKDRTTESWRVPQQAGDIANTAIMLNIRARAWDLFHNNQYASKLVRTIISRVIGVDLTPESKATQIDGSSFDEFRTRAKQLYNIFKVQASDLGLPGQGGAILNELYEQILKEIIVGGEVLIRFRKLNNAEQKKRELKLPYTIQVIEGERLSDDTTTSVENGNIIFRGIELDSEGRRVAYHIYDQHPNHPARNYNRTVKRIPADEILHIYRQDRPSQLRGVTWLAPIMILLRHIGTYQENEILASTVSSCVALVITKSSNTNFGRLNAPTGGDNLDADDNRIDRIQPMSTIYLREGEEASDFNPTRPNAQATEFIDHLLRSVSAGTPAVKPSQLTGDYRRSSYSSERTAENDVLPEVELLQNWFFACVASPIYKEMIEAGMLAGWFDNISLEIKTADETCLCDAEWHGPVSHAIDPVKETKASGISIQNGTSSVQIETASRGIEWRRILRDAKQLQDFAEENEIPQQYIDNLLGIDPSSDDQIVTDN